MSDIFEADTKKETVELIDPIEKNELTILIWHNYWDRKILEAAIEEEKLPDNITLSNGVDIGEGLIKQDLIALQKAAEQNLADFKEHKLFDQIYSSISSLSGHCIQTIEEAALFAKRYGTSLLIEDLDIIEKLKELNPVNLVIFEREISAVQLGIFTKFTTIPNSQSYQKLISDAIEMLRLQYRSRAPYDINLLVEDLEKFLIYSKFVQSEPQPYKFINGDTIEASQIENFFNKFWHELEIRSTIPNYIQNLMKILHIYNEHRLGNDAQMESVLNNIRTNLINNQDLRISFGLDSQTQKRPKFKTITVKG